MVRTSPLQGGNTGSIPVGATTEKLNGVTTGVAQETTPWESKDARARSAPDRQSDADGIPVGAR